MMELKQEDKIWIAGFFDGEGNIQLYLRPPTYSNPYGQYILVTSVVQTNADILEQFTSFGGRLFQASKANHPSQKGETTKKDRPSIT